MSHQTGISPNDQLKKFITKCKSSSKTRILKVSIKDECLVLDDQKEPHGKWEGDFERYVNNLTQPKTPCYLLLRLDSKNNEGNYLWHLLNWTPEEAPVREKMLYASTKATLKKEFGTSYIVYDYFASTVSELSLSSFKNFLEAKQRELNGETDVNLLTLSELDLMTVKREESSSQNAKPTKTLPGIEFPLTEEAKKALIDLKDGVISYLQLSIKNEEIHLDKRESHKDFDLKDVPGKVPPQSPRYHLFLFPHTHAGLYHKSVVFIYSVAGSNCSVKERMLYSSAKNALMSCLHNQIGITVDKKIESDDPQELTEDFLIDQLHPKDTNNDLNRKQFDKPAPPAGKRAVRRLIRD